MREEEQNGLLPQAVSAVIVDHFRQLIRLPVRNMREIDTNEVQERFEDLIEEAANGNSFIITVNGVPKAKVTPVNESILKELESEAAE